MINEPLPPLVLIRPAPNRALNKVFMEGVPDDVTRRVTGDDGEFGLTVPALFRILAAPEAPAVFPRAPKAGDPLWASCQYWYPLIHMLRYSLGWARLDMGLWWWHQEGKPRNDPRLRILADIYDHDGYLDAFCAWLWVGSGATPGSHGFDQFGWSDSGGKVPANPAWIERQLRDLRTSGLPGTEGGDFDSLHLSGHGSLPLEGRQGGFLHFHSDEKQRRAVVVFENMIGWYHGLSDLDSYLPSIKGQSWYVDVFVKPVGWLGTYRRSRATGLWFSGQHRFHTPGT